MTIGPEGKITDVNTATELATGVSRAELIGTEFSSYFTEPEKASAGYQQVFAQGSVTDYPLSIRHKSGHVMDVLYNVTVYKDAAGNVQGVFAAARDVTERKRAEEVQRAASAYARSLIEASLDPLVTISAEGKITDVNEASVQATGVPREQLIGTDFSDYFTEPDKAREGYRRVFAEGFVRDYPLALRHVSGRVTDVLYNAGVYRDEQGHVLGVFAAARDITERKQAAATLRQLNEQLEQRVRERTAQLEAANQQLRQEMAERKQAGEALKRIEWLLTRHHDPTEARQDAYAPPHRDLVPPNTPRFILNAVCAQMLTDIVRDYPDLLDTSAAVYEKNGDYALGIFSSGWCRFMDAAARAVCGTADNREALTCGRWHCHESCWTNASKVAVATGQPADIECNGGIRLYAVPVRAGGEIVGSINFGYGDPPRDPAKLKELAAQYGVRLEDLRQHAEAYETRPPFIIELAKRRLQTSARLIGEIIERRRAEVALREEETRYRTLFEQSPDGVLIVDTQTGLPIEFNAVAHRQLGYTREEFARLRVNDYEAVESPEETKARIEKILREGRDDFETQHRRKTGELRNVLVTVRVIQLSGRPVLHSIFRDITERKAVEGQLKRSLAGLERSNQELEQFAYVASHDLQEPLRMVSSYTQLLAQRYEGQLDAKAKKFIRYAVDGAIRMQTLINELLTYSRVGTQGKPLEPTDSHSALGEAIRNLAAMIEENRAIITNDDLPTVRADAAQLVLVFQNLLANAIKFRREDLPRVHVSAQDQGREWVFAVRDNGIGIEPQHAERVFVIFQRLHTRQEYPGTGIGLAVCKRIVERHGGKIWFESEPGNGSTFFFAVPK